MTKRALYDTFVPDGCNYSSVQTTYDTAYKCKALVVEALPRLLHVKPPQLAVRGLIPVAAASWAFSQQLCARRRLRQEVGVCFPLQHAYMIQTT